MDMTWITFQTCHCLQKVFPITSLYDVKLPLFTAWWEKAGAFFLRTSLALSETNFQQKILLGTSCGMSQTLGIL